MTRDLYLSIGTNMGDRQAYISQALELLDAELGVHYDRLSSIIETESWGFEGPNFLNCAVKYCVDIEPLEVLHICKKIEAQLGRNDTPEYNAVGERVYHDRPIDIDIVLYGDIKMDTPELTIPHPKMYEREFVMVPLKEIF